LLKNSRLKIEAGFASETGRRSANEDYVGVLDPGGLQADAKGIVAAIADGVGGARGGRVAAELAVRSFIDGMYGQSETIGPPRAAATAIGGFNRWLHAMGQRDEALENAATTFTSFLFRGRAAHVFHVGDSRAYRLSGGELTRLTEDHTLRGPDVSHILYRAVGVEASVRLDHAVQPLRPHDRFLLCSDGVHGVLSDRRIADLLGARASPSEDAERIVAAALAAGSEDNVTAMVIDILETPEADQAALGLAMAALPIRDAPMPGNMVDGFELTSLLSDGRYSRLFKAVDTHSGRMVAIKFPKPAVASASTYHLAFMRESWVAARLRSPLVGEVIELAPDRQSCLYSVMPFYEGDTLEARLRRAPPITLGQGIAIGLKLAKAVAALHRFGIIHRDIKPDNVVIEADGGQKLIDLGVVRLPRMEDFPPGDVPGTPSYMAPELFNGEPGDELSDIFAIGVTLYRAFSGGAYPYGEIEPFSRPRFGKPTPLGKHRPDLPAWLDRVIARAIAVDRKERFDDVTRLILELEEGFASGPQRKAAFVPLYQRNPLLVWQLISIALALALAISLADR
jgi:serine/threonine protein phosphatase PrpC